MGKKMGLWNHGFDFPAFAAQLFHDIDFRNKTMLEIGCGKGMLCVGRGRLAMFAEALQIPANPIRRSARRAA